MGHVVRSYPPSISFYIYYLAPDIIEKIPYTTNLSQFGSHLKIYTRVNKIGGVSQEGHFRVGAGRN